MRLCAWAVFAMFTQQSMKLKTYSKV